jgi:hypothetical protein
VSVPRKLTVLVPLLYVSVIALFMWLQFGSGESVTQSAGGLQVRSVRASLATSAEGTAVRRTTVAYRGAEFRFSRLRPLLLGEPPVRLHPVSVVVSGDGVSVAFRGARGRALDLVFLPDAGGLVVSADTEAPLALPLESPGGRVEGSTTVPAISIIRGDQSLVALLPQQTRARWAGGYLYMSGPDNSLRLAPGDGGSLLTQWLLAQGSLVSDDAWKREMAAYRDRAYEGWVRSRYLQDLGLWRGADGQPTYSDALGSAFLAEAASRGEHARALYFVQQAEAMWLRLRPTAVIGHETSAFTGVFGDLTAWRAELQRPEVREALRLLRAGDPAVWRTEGLVRSLQAAGYGSAFAEAGEKALAKWDPATGEIAAALGLLEASLDAQGLPWLASAGDRALAAILGRLRMDGGRLRLASGERPDVAVDLRAGALLARAGEARQSQALTRVGRTLIVTALRTADGYGFIGPAGGLRLSPEDAYHLARLSPYLPSLRVLDGALGPGVSVWSAAQVKSASSGGDVTLTFAFAPGVPHHVLFRGLAPVREIKLRGVPWRPDPAYNNYFAGWFYYTDNSVLALKLTQEQGEEQVVITR